MYNGKKVLDVHGHISRPPEYMAYAATVMASNGPAPVGGFRITDEKLEVMQQRHLKELDDRRIDVQLLGPRPFSNFHWMRPHLQDAWSRFTNDLIAQAVRLHPDRFLGMAQLPQSAELDTRHCLPELNRCIHELGFVGAYVNPDPSGNRDAPGMDDPYWFPLYERAQELGIGLIVHPAATFDRRVERITNNYQFANVIEEYIATQLLSHTDVFERFPGLRITVCHCGGALERFIKSDPHVSQRDISKNLFFDTCAHDVDFLTAAIKQRGVAQMLFGSEVPGSGGAPRPETGRPADDLVPVIAGFDFLSEDDKLRIFNGNPKAVFPQFARLDP
jgi:predicted TIM-barrel fold metal-dependent hydrolase